MTKQITRTYTHMCKHRIISQLTVGCSAGEKRSEKTSFDSEMRLKNPYFTQKYQCAGSEVGRGKVWLLDRGDARPPFWYEPISSVTSSLGAHAGEGSLDLIAMNPTMVARHELYPLWLSGYSPLIPEGGVWFGLGGEGGEGSSKHKYWGQSRRCKGVS